MRRRTAIRRERPGSASCGGGLGSGGRSGGGRRQTPVEEAGLGHASISTTERYDNQKLAALQAATQRLEDGKEFQPLDDGTKFQESFKIDPKDQPEPLDDADANLLKGGVLRNGSGTVNHIIAVNSLL